LTLEGYAAVIVQPPRQLAQTECEDLFDQWPLRGKNEVERFVEAKVRQAIDFGERRPPARSRGPLHLEFAGLEASEVQIAFGRPTQNPLSTSLTQRGQWMRDWRRFKPGLFFELAKRSCKRRLISFDLSLGHHPRARVPPRPERSAGMTEQDFNLAHRPMVDEQAGANRCFSQSMRPPITRWLMMQPRWPIQTSIYNPAM
jgi:hypothetical protein